MRLKIILFLFVTFCCINCRNEKSRILKTINTVSKPKDFEVFIKKFKPLELPLTINPLEIQSEKSLPLTKTDFKFIDLQDIDPILDNIYPYGILPDTLNSYKVIYLFPSEIYLPVIATYSKDGKRISVENLSVGDCGSDCGYTCKEFIQVYSDLKIYSVDSIKSYDCDSLGIIENTLKKYIRFKKGMISNDGMITMSEVSQR